MKNLSIRLKITLWFSAVLALMVAITCGCVLLVSRQVFLKTIRDSLVETVEDNVNEIKFFSETEDVELSAEANHFILYQNGFLEIDDDFLDAVNEVYTALYQKDGTLLYGENPIARETTELEFSDSRIQKKRVGGILYYIFDRKLERPGLEGLWLRGTVSEEQGDAQVYTIFRLSLIVLPVLMLLALIGGYLIAGRMLRPLKVISDTVSLISRSGDLGRRIELGMGKDELHRLAGQFDEMFDRLEESFETERQFTSDASHELRTPMSVIMAQCEYSMEEPQTEEEYQGALEVIHRQGKKMTRLIEDMLDFSRLEQGAERYGKEPLDFGELVRSVCEDMALIQEKGIRLTFQVEEGVVLLGNRELLTRLLSNLIGNAYRYGKENGHIFVKLEKNEREARLSVEDDGSGIARSEQEKIFHRFYQADNARTGEGSGLGLAMVQEIAGYHGGTVWVESEPGIGSTFFVLMFL